MSEPVNDARIGRVDRRVSKSRGGRQRGFIVTLSLIAFMSVFGLIIVYGAAVLQEIIVNKLGDYFGSRILVYDSTGSGGPPPASYTAQLLGQAVGYNQYEAPFVIRREGSGISPSKSYAALLGVRADSVTTRQRVYYEDYACSTAGGNAKYILNPGSALGTEAFYGCFDQDFTGINTNECLPFPGPYGGLVQRVSDFYPLEGRAYAIGNGQLLYYVDRTDALVVFPAPPAARIGSYWDSEVYPDGACFAFTAGGHNLTYQLDNLSVVTASAIGLGTSPYWIPAALSDATQTTVTTDSGTMGTNPSGTESTTPPNLGSPAGSQPPCPEGTVGCPGL